MIKWCSVNATNHPVIKIINLLYCIQRAEYWFDESSLLPRTGKYAFVFVIHDFTFFIDPLIDCEMFDFILKHKCCQRQAHSITLSQNIENVSFFSSSEGRKTMCVIRRWKTTSIELRSDGITFVIVYYVYWKYESNSSHYSAFIQLLMISIAK